ncbi:MAG: DUF6146 family protein [Bacteroidota bacterium]
MKKKKWLRLVPIMAFLLLSVPSVAQKDSLNISKEEKAYFDSEDEEAVELKSEETEYEIIIIEPGFNAWLNSFARPEGYYSQQFLENRNNILVINWNQRVQQPFRFNPNLYQFQIDYSPSVDYGYEVNYKLYNYFIFFQRKYRQRLGPFVPRI